MISVFATGNLPRHKGIIRFIDQFLTLRSYGSLLIFLVLCLYMVAYLLGVFVQFTFFLLCFLMYKTKYIKY